VIGLGEDLAEVTGEWVKFTPFLGEGRFGDAVSDVPVLFLISIALVGTGTGVLEVDMTGSCETSM